MHRTIDDFTVLLKVHYSRALQYCRSLYTNYADAEDGLQEAIISAMKHFKSLKDDSKFKSWFFTILTRTFYNFHRKQSGIHRIFVPLEVQHQGFPELYKDSGLEEREQILVTALNTLNETERAAILLFEIGGLTLEEIRKIQKEKSISAIKSRLSRTRAKLRNSIIEIEKINTEKVNTHEIKITIPENRS